MGIEIDKIRAYPMVVLLLPLVAAILFVDSFHPIRQPWHKTAPNATQTVLYQRLANGGLSGDELATVGALTLGYKEDLDKEVLRHFRAAGAAHILAVSGLHTGIIYGVLLWLLTIGGRFRPMHENRLWRCMLGSVIIAAMWGYAWLTGMTPSVVRAVVMVTLVEFGKMIYRNSLTINTVASAAVLILLVKPQDLWSVSFQLSFTATAVIVIFAALYRYNGITVLRRARIIQYLAGIVLVSVAAQLGTLPLTMYYFKQVSTYFLLANLCVLPIATLLVPCGLVSIALGGSVCGVWFSKVTWCLAWLMNHSVGWIESLPGSTFPAHVNGIMVAIYYVIFVFFCLFWAKTSKKR